MELNKTLQQAIDKRLQTFLFVSATITLPKLRHSQISSFNEIITYKPDEPNQRQVIEQFQVLTQLRIEETSQLIQSIPDDYPSLNSWQNYINELREQLDSLKELLLNPIPTYFVQL
jgi:hypothetical protein